MYGGGGPGMYASQQSYNGNQHSSNQGYANQVPNNANHNDEETGGIGISFKTNSIGEHEIVGIRPGGPADLSNQVCVRLRVCVCVCMYMCV